MSDEKYIYHPFQQGRARPTVKIYLRKKAKGQVVSEEAEEAEPEYGVLPGVIPPDELAPAFKGITFYDLGTRKNEDGTYRDLWPYLTPPLPDSTYDWWTHYHLTLLQGDFKKECLQIPQAAQYLYFDANFLPAGLDFDNKQEIIGAKNKRPYISNIGTIGAPNASTSHWARANLRFKPPAETGDYFLSLESALYYNGFYTQDPNNYAQPFYRVTASADPTGPAINSELSFKGKEKIFLTPVLASNVVSTGPTRVRVTRRLPIIPKFGPQVQPLTTLGYAIVTVGGVLIAELRMRASAELWAAMDAYFSASYPPTIWHESLASIPNGAALGDFTSDGLVATNGIVTDVDENVVARNGFLGYDLLAHPRTLVAIVVQGAKTYYVWQNSVQSQELRVVHGAFVTRPGPDVVPGSPRMFWTHTRIYHPA